MEDDDTDYVTILPTLHPQKVLVCVMKYHKGDYVQGKVTQPLTQEVAERVAKDWATVLKLEIR